MSIHNHEQRSLASPKTTSCCITCNKEQKQKDQEEEEPSLLIEKHIQEHEGRMNTCAEYDSSKLPRLCSKMSKLKPSILRMKASNNSNGCWSWCQTALLDEDREPQQPILNTIDDRTLHINNDTTCDIHLSSLPSVRFNQVTIRVYDPAILPLVGDDNKSSSSSLDAASLHCSSEECTDTKNTVVLSLDAYERDRGPTTYKLFKNVFLVKRKRKGRDKYTPSNEESQGGRYKYYSSSTY